MVFGEMSSSEISNDPRHPSSIICPSGRWETCSSFRYRHSSLLVRSSPASYCNGVRSDRARNTPKPATQPAPEQTDKTTQNTHILGLLSFLLFLLLFSFTSFLGISFFLFFFLFLRWGLGGSFGVGAIRSVNGRDDR
jgi:hypothetical protein